MEVADQAPQELPTEKEPLVFGQVERAPQSRKVARRALTVALAAAALLAFATWQAPAGHNRIEGLKGGADFNFQEKDEVEVGPQCGEIHEDTDYKIESTEGYGVDYIPSVDNCCALCWGDSRCKAWIYVRQNGDTASQCWIKFGEPSKKVPKQGVVSGLAPARQSFKGAQNPAGIVAEPSLFCFALMLPFGSEIMLLRWQLEHRVSIFACNDVSVYTNTTMDIVPGFPASFVDSDLVAVMGGYSMTALNSWVFIAVWKAVIQEGKYLKNDWTVKVDPDAVFFPERLQFILRDHEGAPYINNCKYGLHGPIEVLSRKTIGLLAKDYNISWDGKAPKRCVTEQHFGLYGEDMFLDICLKTILDVGEAPLETKLLCEAHCDCKTWYWCDQSADTVSYHPFKTVDSYSACMAVSQGAPAAKGSDQLAWQEKARRVPARKILVAQSEAAADMKISRHKGSAYGSTDAMSGKAYSTYTSDQASAHSGDTTDRVPESGYARYNTSGYGVSGYNTPASSGDGGEYGAGEYGASEYGAASVYGAASAPTAETSHGTAPGGTVSGEAAHEEPALSASVPQ